MNGQTPEQIEAEIAQQREELAATVSELHARLDVKSRAGAAVKDPKNRPILAAGAAALVGAVGLVIWRRTR